MCHRNRSAENTIEQLEYKDEEIGSYVEIFSFERFENCSNLLLEGNDDNLQIRRLNQHALSAFTGWKPRRGEVHPRFRVHIEVKRSSYQVLDISHPKITVAVVSSAVADTGAKMVERESTAVN